MWSFYIHLIKTKICLKNLQNRGIYNFFFIYSHIIYKCKCMFYIHMNIYYKKLYIYIRLPKSKGFQSI